MSIDAVAANYMKFIPFSKQISKPDAQTGSAVEKATDNATQQRDQAFGKDAREEKISSSNATLDKMISDAERKTIAKLFGERGVAKLDELLGAPKGNMRELPRGVLVNVKV